MWGQLFLEASIQQNFNFGFSTHKSDVLIHLSQWQYWWWFWFSLVWVVYYYVILTDTTKRSLTFNPILNTSLRSHGKWGDFLVALIPLSWCGNILVNSNFILRIIEWQNESSLFTLRIQGKQWYWVYKYDGNAAVMIDTAPKNIGHDRWLITSSNESYCVDSYYQALHLAAQLEFQDMYSVELKKTNITKKILESSTLYSNQIFTPNTENNINIQEITPFYEFVNYGSNSEQFDNIIDTQVDVEQNINPSKSYLQKNLISAKKVAQRIRYYQAKLNLYNYMMRKIQGPKKFWPAPKDVLKPCLLLQLYSSTNKLKYFKNEVSFIDLYNNSLVNQHYDLLKLDDTQNTFGNMRILLAKDPIVLHAGILNDHVVDVVQSNVKLTSSLLFTTTINNNLVEPKINHTEDLWGFRQKRYKRLKEFKFTPKQYFDPLTFQPISSENQSFIRTYSVILNKQINIQNQPESETTPYVGNLSYKIASDQPYTPTSLNVQKTQTVNSNNAYYFYSSLKLNKKRSEVLSVNLARRLLRTKRTLVLPVHVNITVITNSYDVVHSWFIPGLGLKLDCVPGRSTHHTLYVDNVGFYYGQCAEICGRYHHHMPIRVCAIPFEQFLVWWHTKGLPRTLRLHHNKVLLMKNNVQIPLHKAFIHYRYNF